jgi:hypothetical protein
VGLVERRMLVVLLARASNTGSICTPICRQIDSVMSRLAIDNVAIRN